MQFSSDKITPLGLEPRMGGPKPPVLPITPRGNNSYIFTISTKFHQPRNENHSADELRPDFRLDDLGRSA